MTRKASGFCKLAATPKLRRYEEFDWWEMVMPSTPQVSSRIIFTSEGIGKLSLCISTYAFPALNDTPRGLTRSMTLTSAWCPTRNLTIWKWPLWDARISGVSIICTHSTAKHKQDTLQPYHYNKAEPQHQLSLGGTRIQHSQTGMPQKLVLSVGGCTTLRCSMSAPSSNSNCTHAL